MRLELSGVTKRYGRHSALDGVTLLLPDVRALALIGPSGGGKSTLLRIIAGLDTPDEGSVTVDSEQILYEEEWLIRWRRSIGTVFQAFNLFPHLTALCNIMLPLEKVHGFSRDEALLQAEELLDRFQLSDHGDKKPAQLSGGQKQRVAIARAVAIRPRFLLFDEPTSALDPEMTAEVLDIIAELREEGRDLILVTHEMGFARRAADRCIFLADGKVVEAGPADQVLGNPESPVVRDFLARVLRG